MISKTFLAIFISLFTLTIGNCGNQNDSGKWFSYKKSALFHHTINPADPDTIPLLDTTIVLKERIELMVNAKVLTSVIAEKVLYSYYREKGYLIQKELTGISDDEDDESALCVSYDTLYLFNNSSCAIVTYWIAPPYSSGHCFQPSKSIIVATENGFTITNEEFIPIEYCVERIDTAVLNPIIYGYEYDCPEDITIRNLKITLK